MMSFQPQKCQLRQITRNKSPVKASYVIHGHTLAETDTAKYLGVSLHRHSSWSPRQCHSQEGQWNSSLPPEQPTQGDNCSEDTHIRIPHTPNPWILRCGLGPPQRPRRKQARDGTTPVRPLHIPGLCHPENSRLGTPSGTPREGPHHHGVHNSSWSCWHPGIGPHHTGTCKQKERQCPVPRTIRADFGIPARNLRRRHAPVERHSKWGYRSRMHRHL